MPANSPALRSCTPSSILTLREKATARAYCATEDFSTLVQGRSGQARQDALRIRVQLYVRHRLKFLFLGVLVSSALDEEQAREYAD